MFRSTVLVLVTLGAVTGLAAPPAPGSISGSITAINGNTITLAGVTLDVGGVPVTTPTGRSPLVALAVGDHATVSLSPSHAVMSVLVDAAISVRGSIDSVQSSTLTLLGRSFTLAPTTLYGGYVGTRLLRSAADLQSGDGIAVDATGAGTAQRVWGLTAAPAAPSAKPIASQSTITGIVTQLDATTCTIAGTKVLLSKQTKLGPGLVVGVSATAIGLGTPDGSILGVRITAH